MTFSPSTLTGTYGSGDSIGVSVRVTLSTPLSDEVYINIVDGAGAFKPNIYIQASSSSPDTYYASLSTSPQRPPGRHQGIIEVWLCHDAACSAPYPGSPAYLPYDLQVLQGTNLTPLTRWPSLGDWVTYQGTAAHTGHVPVTLDPSRFSPRWSWRPPDSYISLTPPVIANGMVYVANSMDWFLDDAPRTLYALRESDGEAEWLFNFGNTRTVNPPAVSGGKVFVATTYENSGMWSFDAATGIPLSKTAFGSQFDHYYAPTIENGVVYSNCETYGGLCAFNFADGTRNWFNPLTYADDWTPAVDATYAYAFLKGVLSALDKSTGAVAFTIADPGWQGDGFGTYGAPVLGANGAVIAVSGSNGSEDNRLVSFNTTSRGLNWSVTGRFGGAPVLAKGVVYVTHAPGWTSRPRMEARRESTGALLWSWTPPDDEDMARSGRHGDYFDLLVTDNLLFVSTSERVYALDLATRAPVWTYWRPGNLAISANGVLYIAGGGTIGAVNLK